MGKNQRKNVQAAQGMVEFALVLPLLLMLIFGVFAFGHLLFAYSSVVSASREAARWAAAIDSSSGKPRFQDCDSIRAAAVRVGSFAGVQPAGITISYDKGPGKAWDTSQGTPNCPISGTGPNLALGDRINVQVSVQYRPIVPLVNINPFNLRANTARTIIRGVSVGAAPTAEAACNWTAIHVTVTYDGIEHLTPPYQVVVGQPVLLTFEVASPNGLLDKGQLDLTIEGTKYSYISPSGPSGSKTYQFNTVGTGKKIIQADYFPDTPENMGGECYQLSTYTFEITVVKAETSIILYTDQTNPLVDKPSLASNTTKVPVYFQVIVDAPGSGTPAGTGTVTVKDETRGILSVPVNLSVGYALFTWSTAGNYLLSATYSGDANFNPSTFPDPNPPVPADPAKYFTHTVTNPPATQTCPTIDKTSLVPHTTGGNYWLGFKMDNPSAGIPTDVTQLDLTWPAPTPPNTAAMILTQVCTRDAASTNNCTQTGYTPVWSGVTALVPTIPTFVPLAPASATTMAAGGSKYFYLTFNGALYTNSFLITAHFANASNTCTSDTITYP